MKTRRRTSPLPMLFALALLLFATGIAVGWCGATAHAPDPARPEDPGAAVPVPTTFTPPLPAPTAEPSEEPSSAPNREDWALTLVNFDHPLPDDFSIPALTELRNGHAIDSRAYPALQAMMDGARAAGLQPLICSSLRTWDDQERLFTQEVQNWLDQGYTQEDAETRAAMWVARPGASEHQTGLAVDIVDVSYQLLDQGQEDTPVQKWLMAHCAEYGFVLRYPTEKGDLTGVNYEPWHYRYVGMDAAKEIMAGGLCLEEYLLK